MQEFTGSEYLRIDIANTFGLDKITWDERLNWFDQNKLQLDSLVESADKKYLFSKAIETYKDNQLNLPTGHIMYLDATASGYQIMACLSGCIETAKAVNLVNTGKREDLYTEVMSKMNNNLPSFSQVTREDTKKPTMTDAYNKATQESFLENQAVAFHNIMNSSLPGARAVKEACNTCFDGNAYSHSWRLPDGHLAYVPVTDIIDSKIEVDELNHASFTYRHEVNTPNAGKWRSLAPNIIHSIDGYIVREMIRRLNILGISILPIHDAFGAHPNHMNEVRATYRDILSEIASSTLLEDILNQLGLQRPLFKFSNNLSDYINESEYTLS